MTLETLLVRVQLSPLLIYNLGEIRMLNFDRKYCFDCKNLLFEASSPDYSEVTPGCDSSFFCLMGHWNLDNMCFAGEFKGYMELAETCKDFSPREPTK